MAGLHKPCFFQCTSANGSVYHLAAHRALCIYGIRLTCIYKHITMINGEAKGLIEDVGCGVAVKAGDAAAFAEAVLRISQMSSRQHEELGCKGRDFSIKHFNFELQMNLLEEIING